MAGDVVELILADHRKFEELLRSTRDVSADRRAAPDELSDLLVAHAEAEGSNSGNVLFHHTSARLVATRGSAPACLTSPSM